MNRERFVTEVAAVIGSKVYSKRTGQTYVVVWIQWNSEGSDKDPKIRWIMMLNLKTAKTMKVDYSLFIELVNKQSLILGFFEPEVSHDHIITHEILQQLKR